MPVDVTTLDEGDPLKWVQTNCARCGSSDSKVCFEGPDRLEGLPGNFRFVECTTCGTFRQDPRLPWESLAKFYPENYTAYDYIAAENKNIIADKIRNRGNRKRRRAIEQYQPGGRLLEVGCGTGAFIQELLKAGNWTVEGIEPGEKAALHVRNSLNIPVIHGLFEEADLESGAYDAIVMWCVLEHLENPVKSLQKSYSLLKNGGWLFFSIPNYECLEAKFFGEFWAGWDLPRHMYVFPRPVLLQVLDEIGFRNIKTRCISTSYHMLGHSLDFWSQSWAEKHPGLKSLLDKAYWSWPARLALFLPLAVLDRLKLSSNITYFVQKPPA